MTLRNHFFIYIFILLLAGCDNNNDPQKEDVPEMITKVTLKFTGGGQVVTVTATDPDGDGVQNIQTDGSLKLSKNTQYTMTMELINGLADPGDEAYNVTAEVNKESDEHMFFFAWTNNAFSTPSGNGNIDNRSDPVDYQDVDANSLPLGLNTKWKTTDVATPAATLRVLLKHQPALKSATSSSSDGETDLDLTFDLVVE